MSTELPSQPSPEPGEADTVSQISTPEENTVPTTTALQKRPSSDFHSDFETPDLKRTKSQADHTSSLMSLASEIRVKILHYLLFSDKPLEIRCRPNFICANRHYREHDCRTTHRPEQSYLLFPEILRANRCLYEEGKTVLYGKNTMGIRVPARDSNRALYRDEIQVTMLDHANVLQIEEPRHHQDRRPSVPPDEFYNFYIHIQLEQNHSAGRLKSTLRELVMNLNRHFPLGKPRALTLCYEQQLWGSIFCESCDLEIDQCDDADQEHHPNKLRCRGPPDRQKESAKKAAKILKPFEFLHDVTSVTFEDVVPDNADELSSLIKYPHKEADLFPLYWATLCWIQRVSDDPYTQSVGYSWLGCEGDLWDEPDSDVKDKKERRKDEFRMGPTTAHWKCLDWLVERMGLLRHSMEAGDESKFRRRRSAIRCLVSSVLKDVQDRLIYMFEDLRPPPEDVEDEKEWNAPESEPPENCV